MSAEPIRIMGAQGSPYSRKLRAVLRHRRIPHVWIHQGSPESRDLPQPRVHLLPQLFLPGEDGALEARVDSSPLIRLLEKRHAGRSVIPDDPVVRFLDELLEDYADEWLTKAMFHYRWAFPADVANAAAILPRWFRTDQADERVEAAGKEFAARQVGRLGVVGSNATTAPIIEDSYRRLLKVLDAHLATSPFVMGSRPGAADFGIYGQLTQLAGFDPTPMTIARETAPRVAAWVDLVEDLSGIELESREWVRREAVPDGLRALLGEVGRFYAPFLVANAEAVQRAAESVECKIDGRLWAQRPFAYQEKCLRWLRESHAALAAGDRAAVDALLRGTGCEVLFGG